MWSEFWSSLWSSLLFSFLRPMLKWVLRLTTGKCELLRITYEENAGSQRTKRIEKSLKLSKDPYLKNLINCENMDIEEATIEVLKLKQIVTEVHSQFSHCFKCCLKQVQGYKHLLEEVETVRQVKYSSETIEHEEKLIQLWKVLMPDIKLESRISKQWTDIGFQGDDPKTDFRGMGILGLNQLLYFGEKYADEAKQVLSQSHHPSFGYSYAVVGINLTSMIYTMLKSGKLRTHFYNLDNDSITIEDFHEIYCYVFQEFNKFWFSEKPKDIMEFGRLRDKFNQKILTRLKEPRTILQYENSKK